MPVKAENLQKRIEQLKAEIEKEARRIARTPHNMFYPSQDHLILSEGGTQYGLGRMIFTDIQSIIGAIDALNTDGDGYEFNDIVSALLSGPDYKKLYKVALARYIEREIPKGNPTIPLDLDPLEKHIKEYLELFSDDEKENARFGLVDVITDAVFE